MSPDNKALLQNERDLLTLACLSAQSILGCCPYTQGCSGGLPLLAAKCAFEFGLPTEKCCPYSIPRHEDQSDELSRRRTGVESVCHDPARRSAAAEFAHHGVGKRFQCAQSARVTVADYYYVGGYYGAAASFSAEERAALLQREVPKVEFLAPQHWSLRLGQEQDSRNLT